MITDGIKSASGYPYNMDYEYFTNMIYEYFRIDASSSDAQNALKIKLRQTIKAPEKFFKLLAKLGMNENELLSIVYDMYPKIFNKKCREFVRIHYITKWGE